MPHPALDRFGELLMRDVRDRAIGDWEQILHGKMKDAHSQDVFKLLSPQERATLSRFAPEIVDSTLHWLLCLLDGRDDLRLAIDLGEQSIPSISAISDGLPGELGTAEGWIERFSRKGKAHGTE